MENLIKKQKEKVTVHVNIYYLGINIYYLGNLQKLLFEVLNAC